MPYLMESPKEAERLLMKSDEESSRAQLLLTGLKPGMTAIDAGGGVGFVTRIMSQIVGPKGRVYLIDQSDIRLKAAKEQMKALRNVLYLDSSLENIKLDSNIIDYSWCRFVFEYLPEQKKAFDEIYRVSKAGGKIAIGDLDYNCMSHFPLAPHLEQQLNQIISELQRLKLWDPYAGRKLFSYFNEAGVKDIKVHLLPHHLIYGESQRRDIDNWVAKMEMIKELSSKGMLKFNFDLDSFKNEFFAFFENPSRFSYSPLILVEGVK
ncbi:MAG: methyltransferase domain-containing protein [Deltaproteobacteria bacterium]|nr:methyltransferase domain-containing protein [Deltaproteobacteria bacterium]